MTTFAERMNPARAWELNLLDWLRKQGYSADLFGQGQLSDYWRGMLCGYRDSFGRPALIRWMPDIIAAVPDDPTTIVFIDAKTGNGNTGNYSIEINAVSAALAFENLLYVPVLFVWQDGRVLSAYEISNRRFKRMDGADAKGSGTAFYLIKRDFATPVREKFPKVAAKAG